jgi:hypothetical protein
MDTTSNGCSKDSGPISGFVPSRSIRKASRPVCRIDLLHHRGASQHLCDRGWHANRWSCHPWCRNRYASYHRCANGPRALPSSKSPIEIPSLTAATTCCSWWNVSQRILHWIDVLGLDLFRDDWLGSLVVMAGSHAAPSPGFYDHWNLHRMWPDGRISPMAGQRRQRRCSTSDTGQDACQWRRTG